MPVWRVLIVEDTPERQKILRSLFRRHAWVMATTGQRAIRLLGAYDFDILTLDYNLRGELTGEDVARDLAAGQKRVGRIIIHSQNPRGAERIARLLPDAMRFPLSRMIRSNAVFKYLRAGIDHEGPAFEFHVPR